MLSRSCIHCNQPFTASRTDRLFCSDRCRVYYHRDERLRCGYCGAMEPDVTTIRKHAWGADKINACPACRRTLGTAYPESKLPRLDLLHERIVKAFQLDRPMPEWSDEETAGLGFNLMTAVRGKIAERRRAIERALHIKALRHATARDEEGSP